MNLDLIKSLENRENERLKNAISKEDLNKYSNLNNKHWSQNEASNVEEETLFESDAVNALDLPIDILPNESFAFDHARLGLPVQYSVI